MASPNTKPEYRAFVAPRDTLTNRLLTKVTIKYNNNSLETTALWDTGATNTCISEDVVRDLSMIPTGKKNMHTASEIKEFNTYLLDVVLTNNVVVQDIEVCDSDIGKQGLGMLIGMDIILLGDFAISNYNNKTTFTFRTPSKEKIDFVKQINIENAIGEKHGKGKRKKKR